jgi:hypothetical protein
VNIIERLAAKRGIVCPLVGLVSTRRFYLTVSTWVRPADAYL